ncbi:hypothetical protein OMP38_03190 [Cohnella ginsengisoli]|uniref:Uncharacterized protein n=1 Tax=Cohnella ginsengisoli TaxID=425004 RepID=A0A9X4KDE5_9BACL|nr:hypothetical protein [Cohnella ginsengisoli]MDG0789968.1 hypothetical protein [Cohnella ginsengisoli]
MSESTVGAKSIGIKANTFISKWNKQISNISSDYRITTSVTQGDVQDVLQETFNDNVGMIATINKNDQTLRNAIIISTGISDPTQAVGLIAAWTTLLQVTSPTLDAAGAQEIVSQLSKAAKDQQAETIVTKGSMRYTFRVNETIGLWLIAENAEDQNEDIKPPVASASNAIISTNEPSESSKPTEKIEPTPSPSIQMSEPSATPSATSTAKPKSEKWNTYQNARFGFELSYPKSWVRGEEPANGDGIELSEKSAGSILAYASFYMEELAPDLTGYKSFTLNNGKKAHLLVQDEGNTTTIQLTYILDKRIQYGLSGSLSSGYYQKNKQTIETMLKSLDFFEGLEG